MKYLNLKLKKLSKLKNNYYKIRIITKIIITFFLIKLINRYIYINKLKICICTLGKDENLYIREFVEYYKKYNVDKIFLYDNNDINGERFEEVIYDYLNKGFVKIKNWRGKENAMFQIMNHCYQTNYLKFDWLIFYEIDEYIFLKNYTNIKTFLSEKKFNKCEVIYLNWVHYTDNNLMHYDNRTLEKRFTEKEPNARKKNSKISAVTKFILKGHIPKIKISSVHVLSRKLKGCNGFGKIITINDLKGNRLYHPDFEYFYIKHFFCKSVEEFITKINKGCAIYGQNENYKKKRIKKYFRYNKITSLKINYIENKTKINLSEYRNIYLK